MCAVGGGYALDAKIRRPPAKVCAYELDVSLAESSSWEQYLKVTLLCVPRVPT